MGEHVTFASDGDRAAGYLALPPGGSGTAVVLIQEWWGLVPHIIDVADRLAAEGFVTLAPDLYRGESTTEPDEAGKHMMALDVGRAARDIAGAAAYLTGLDATTGSAVGTVGFCMGGGLAIWGAAVATQIRAMVGFYPAMLREDWEPDWTRYAGTHVMLHLADGDGGSSSEQIVNARDQLAANGAEVRLFDYPGTEHAFFNDDRPEVYAADASATAWQRTIEFLRQHCV
ncbi:MAG TPA: dienelactone hydrolase family protein [Mycobacteriales bacterium]|jgi:carboxymethylenebutenolidase|nr:dienelactone hydrolase family protein [Mycobacteriales bacterium]